MVTGCFCPSFDYALIGSKPLLQSRYDDDARLDCIALLVKAQQVIDCRRINDDHESAIASNPFVGRRHKTITGPREVGCDDSSQICKVISPPIKIDIGVCLAELMDDAHLR